MVATIIWTAIAMFFVQVAFDWWKNRNKRTDDTNELLSRLIESFQAFVSDFMSKDGLKKQPSAYFVRKSPLELSDAGNKLAKDSGITNFVKQHVGKYTKELNRYKNGIDILKCCRRIALRELGRTDDNEIKNYFYRKGLSQLLMQEIFALKLHQVYSEQKNN